MRILVLGINYAPEPVGIAIYTKGMAEALVDSGHDVTVVTSKPYYPYWRVFDGFRRFGWLRSHERGVDLVRCPIYVPAKPSGAKRILHHLSFAVAALLPTLFAALRKRPDVLFTVGPSLIAAPIARFVAALTGARCWLHIQDFEIEAAFATGLIDDRGIAARAALAFQKYTVRSFDTVSSISPQMCAKLATIGVAPDCIYEFRNWSDVSRIRVLDGPSCYRAEWGITQKTVALYSGNIANKQGIGILVEAARALKNRNDILFIVCGDGPNKRQLMESAGDLPNIRFMPLQPAERLGDLVGLATIHLLPQLAGAADLVLPSKLTNMLASGRPVVATADQGTGLAAEVEGCGLVTAPGDVAAFAAAIARLADDPTEAAKLGRLARTRAEEHWSRDAILARFERRLTASAVVENVDAVAT